MGRGRGKGKKLTAVSSQEDPGSGGEEVLPPYKRRGRPQKPLKDEIDDELIEEILDKDEEKLLLLVVKTPAVVENGRKRKKILQVKENSDSVKEETGVGTRSRTDILKSNGFRPNGSRRKSTPRRAAEAGVECK